MAVPLMHGEEHGRRRSEVELSLLLEGLAQLYDSDFRHHERAVLGSRVAAFMQQHGVPTIAALLAVVLHDEAAARRLCRALLEADTTLFDSATDLAILRDTIGATLSSYPMPRIWAAECTCTEDAFALALLLTESALYARSSIHVTCSDENLLHDMQRGVFSAQKLPAYDAALRLSGARLSLRDYVEVRGEQACFVDALRSRIVWSHYNLGTDRSFNEFQLISCRDSFFRFDRSARRRILGLFKDSLARFGALHFGAELNAEERMYLRSHNLRERHGIVLQPAWSM